MFTFLEAAVLPLVLFFAGVTATTCHNSTILEVADFVFLFDTSPSMCPYNAGVASNFQGLVKEIAKSGVDARYAVLNFGGPIIVRQGLSSNVTETIATISKLGCSSEGQESSLEAIRRVLNNEFALNESLALRSNASLNIFLTTDEDSDLPVSVDYQMVNQIEESFAGANLAEPGWSGYMTFVTGITEALSTSSQVAKPGYRFTYTPSGATTVATSTLTTSSTYTLPLRIPVRTAVGIPTLSPAYQAEVNLTAHLIAEKNAKVSIMMKVDHNDATVNVLDSFTTRKKGSSYNILCSTETSTLTNQDWVIRNNVTSEQCNGTDPLTTWTGVFQFGSVTAASQNSDFTGFDWETTLETLNTHGLGRSLQAQVLTNGTGLVRLYDINIFAETTNSATITNVLAEVASNYAYCQTSYLLVHTTVTVHKTATLKSTHVVSAKTTTTAVRYSTSTSETTATITSTSTLISSVVVATSVVDKVTVVTTNTAEETLTVTTVLTKTVNAPTPVSTTSSQTSTTAASSSSKTPIYVGASIGGAVAVASAAAALFYFRSGSITGASAKSDGFTSMNYNPLFASQTQWTQAWEAPGSTPVVRT